MIAFLKNRKSFARRQSLRRLVAVDFDSRQLRVVYAQRQGGRVRISRMSSTAMPEGMDVANPEAVGAFLGATLKSLHLRHCGLVMCVPRGQAVLKSLKLPPGTPPDEYAAMVQFQMEKELPFRSEEAVIDFTAESHFDVEESGGGPSGESVLVGAVRLPVADYYRQVAESAGMKLRRLGLRPYADRRCVEACTLVGRDARIMLVHLTADETEIDVLRNGALEFSRSAVLRIPVPTAGNEAEVEAAKELVVKEIARSLQSYQAEKNVEISRVLLAGGTGVEAALAEMMHDHIRVYGELFNPAVALGLPEEGPETSAFIAALGLAIERPTPGPQPFDFLNPKRPTVKRNVKRIRLALLAGAVALVVLSGVVIASVQLHTKRAWVSELQQKKGKLAQKTKGVRAIEKQIRAVDEWMDAGRDWLDHWAQLSGLFPSCEDVFITLLKSGEGEMTFAVRAKDTEAIANLKKRLMDAGYDLKPAPVLTRPDPLGYTYGTIVKVNISPAVEVDLSAAQPVPRPADDSSGDSLRRMEGGSSGFRRPEPSPPTREPSPPAEASAQTGSPEPAHTSSDHNSSKKEMTLEERKAYEDRLKEIRAKQEERSKYKRPPFKGGGGR